MKLTEHFCGDLILDRDRKQRAKDHIGRCMACVLFNFDLLPDTCLKAFHSPFSSSPHGRKCFAQTPALKGWINNATLALPHLTIGEEHTVPQQRP